MLFQRIVRPTATCVTLAQVKQNLRIAHSMEDDLIGLFIAAAQDLIEKETSRSIMRQTFRLRTDRVQTRLNLWYPPMEGSITVLNAGGNVGGYQRLFSVQELEIPDSGMLPTLDFGVEAGEGYLDIQYLTGAAEPEIVPAAIRLATMQLAGHFYRNREATTSDSRIGENERKIPYGVEALIKAFRIPNTNVPFYSEA